MNSRDAATVFEILASPIRLDALRLLVQAAPEGLVAGELARQLGLAPNLMSFHLKSMTQADVLAVTQEGRYQRYRANIGLVRDVTEFLTGECCGAEPERCGFPAPDAEATCCDTSCETLA
jgi:DNA-binding transcriptional ArsR family regulator